MNETHRRTPAARQPHAKGSGAFGRFEVTHDVSAYTKAAVFQPGTATEQPYHERFARRVLRRQAINGRGYSTV